MKRRNFLILAGSSGLSGLILGKNALTGETGVQMNIDKQLQSDRQPDAGWRPGGIRAIYPRENQKRITATRS